MSRNLCRVDCDRCGGVVAAVESWRPLTREDAGVYFDEYAGRYKFAAAICGRCLARYLAWCEPAASDHFDLSYRSSFDDEPGPNDLPPWTPPPAPAQTLSEALYELASESVQDDTPPCALALDALLVRYLGPDGPNLLPRTETKDNHDDHDAR